MKEDRKQHKRHPPEVLRVRLEHPSGGERADVVVWDASLGGMFLETSVLLDEGALVALEIETAQAKVSADARVLWSRATAEGPEHPQGMSVRFLDLTDEVKRALTNAIVGGGERTILGVGGATKDTTMMGIPGSREREPERGIVGEAGQRPTQLGVAPPANAPAAPAAPIEVPSTSTPEPSLALDLVTKKPSEPKVEVVRREVTEREQETRRPPRSRSPSPPDDDDDLPKKKSGAGGMLFFLLLLGGGGAAAYYYKDEIAKFIAGPVPLTTVTAEPSASAPMDASTAMVPPSSSAADRVAVDVDGGGKDAAAAHDGGAHDAGIHDAGSKDAGHKEAGAHAHDAGATHAHDAGKPAPKHTP